MERHGHVHAFVGKVDALNGDDDVGLDVEVGTLDLEDTRAVDFRGLRIFFQIVIILDVGGQLIAISEDHSIPVLLDGPKAALHLLHLLAEEVAYHILHLPFITEEELIDHVAILAFFNVLQVVVEQIQWDFVFAAFGVEAKDGGLLIVGGAVFVLPRTARGSLEADDIAHGNFRSLEVTSGDGVP